MQRRSWFCGLGAGLRFNGAYGIGYVRRGISSRDRDVLMSLCKALGRPPLAFWSLMLKKDKCKWEQVQRRAAGMFKGTENLSHRRRLIGGNENECQALTAQIPLEISNLSGWCCVSEGTGLVGCACSGGKHISIKQYTSASCLQGGRGPINKEESQTYFKNDPIALVLTLC